VAENGEQKSPCILRDKTYIQLTGMTEPKMIKTNAARVLDRLGIRYELREYEVDPDDLSAGTVAQRSAYRQSSSSRLWRLRGTATEST
jgi:hypothetical protein